jgi:putative endopeptidase
VIGHEASHGSTTKAASSTATATTQLVDKDDREKFEARTDKLVKQFDAYAPIGQAGLHVNGKLTLGENIADLGGLNVAYDALQVALKQIKEASEDRRLTATSASSSTGPAWRSNVREKQALSSTPTRTRRRVPRDRRAVEHARAQPSSARPATRWCARRQAGGDLVTSAPR